LPNLQVWEQGREPPQNQQILHAIALEGSGVKAAMESFLSVVPKSSVEKENLPILAMQQPAYRLTVALKEELGKAWRTPFGEL